MCQDKVFETFKVFKNEVENQLGKTIKALRSDRGGKYIGQEFKDYLKPCGIIQQLTPPHTSQHNDVSERRNSTLLDMVRSMMNLTTLPLSFWDYALESATCILNMVPTKKVDKTPYELWYGKVSNLSYLKVWGCEVEGFVPPQEEVTPIRSSSCSKGLYSKFYKVDYQETFSPIADIRAIRILISIAAFYDYEICKIDVKTTFLNGYLDEDTYMVQPKGFIDPNHPSKVCKLQRSIYGLNQASRSCNKRFDEEIKREAAFILGMKINRDRSKRLIGLGQNAYMDKIIKRYKMDNSKSGHIPIPDVAFAQNITSRLQQNPSELHWTTVKNILKYLRSTKDMFLVYGGNPEAELRVDCYCDAGFKTDRDDTNSQTRFVFILNEGAVDWKSSKQSITAMSATEAKYIAASKAAMEAVWIRKFISGLGIVPKINEPIRMFCDNSAALHFANEPGVQRGAIHYHRRYYYFCKSIALGEIRFLKVHTDENLADPFMKAISKGKLTQHARSMKLRLASSFM
uniref:Integrase catalytic domain-containing protein n=1 Tax=Tanacetum cinerariifolium TaxID=118510 RepID=A0A6L2LR28_TANCI|nr:hypothetical protein [Tanacetum cinerariifolium]